MLINKDEMQSELGRFNRLEIRHGDVFKLDDYIYIVMCCDNSEYVDKYILVYKHDTQLCRHFNPLTSEDLIDKILTDHEQWEYLGTNKAKISIEFN